MYRLAFHSRFLRTMRALEPNHPWRGQVQECLRRVQEGRWTGGLKVKKLGGKGILEARLNGGDRLLFGRGQADWLVVYDVANHDTTGFLYRRLETGLAAGDGAGDLLTRLRPPDETAPDIGPDDAIPTDPWQSLYGTDDLPRFFTPPYDVWNDPDRLACWAETADTPVHLLLTPEQERLATASESVLLNGSAGSGKSTVIVHGLFAHQVRAGVAGDQSAVAYVTLMPDLRDNAISLYNALVEHRAQNDAPTGRPLFLTYTDFCRELIAEAGQAQPPGELFGEENFRTWYHAWYRRQPKAMRSSMSVAALWCEIRGVIKGRLSDSEQPLLRAEEYARLGGREGTVAVDQRTAALRVAEAYQAALQAAARYDEMDLARIARAAIRHLPRVNPAWRLEAIFCDEVQDLTQAQLSVLFDLRRAYNPFLFLAGDAHQVIYPSAFRWSDLTTFLFRDDLPCLEATLSRNFRSSGAILRAAEASLIGLKRSVLQPYVRAGRWRWDDPPFGAHLGPQGLAPVRLGGSEEDCLRALRSLPANSAGRAILTRTEGQRDWLRDQLNGDPVVSGVKQELVYTIDEFKGLEADCVVLWRLFAGAAGFWASVRAQQDVGLYEGLTECNRLYVALTRARRYLAVVDLPDDPHPWDLPACQGVGLEAQETHWLQVVQAEGGSAQETAQFAALLEGRELFAQAAAAYTNAGDGMGAGRCRALLRERMEQWPEAAAEWYGVRRWDDARRCFSAARDGAGVQRCEAEVWESEAKWAAAAALWHSLEDHRREAACWEAVGEWDRALSAWQAQPEEPAKLAFALRLAAERLGRLSAATASFCAGGSWG